MNDTMVYLYRLRDPTTGEICYIGQAIDLERRRHQHSHFCLTGNLSSRTISEDLLEWFKHLHAHNAAPVMEVIGTVSEANARSAERKAIADAWAEGHPLLNRYEIWSKTDLIFKGPRSVRLENSEWKKRQQQERNHE